MSAFRLLVVEDNDQELDICRDTVKRYTDEKQRNIEIVECKTVKEAFEKLDNSFDGAIIDLRLADQGDEGNLVIERIEQSHFRIPVVILTGTPDAANSDFGNIGVFKKGDPGAGYADLLDRFWGIHNTGLTRIMGGRGTIEVTLNKVFLKNLLPQRDKWVGYGETDSSKTEKALLRYAVSHLLQLLDDDGDRCFPEEVYLNPPLTEKIRTGSVVKEKNNDLRFVVMNPTCDLVIRRNGTCNTDRILIVEIDLQSELFPGYPTNGLSKSQKSDLEKAFRNNKSAYYHWLPKTDFFEGGFLNFRKLISLSSEEFTERFEKPTVQISPSFVKDMVARFSAYYARQGQPDIEFEHFINSPIVKTENP
ncbi:MAG: response regulator [Chlorobiaceae bacterium]|nr:response regulator [Chlorobiaceae bacterium]